MRIFTPELQAYGFLAHLINSKLVAYSKHTALVPEFILAVNLSDSARELLRHTYPNAQVKYIAINELNLQQQTVAHASVDLIIANLTAANETQLLQIVELAERVLKRDDMIVFATWDHADKSYLPKSLNTKIIDEIKVLAEIDAKTEWHLVSHKEKIFHAPRSNEEIACHIFVGHIDTENALQNTYEPDEASDSGAGLVDEEINDIAEIVLEDEEFESDELIDREDDNEEASIVDEVELMEEELSEEVENESEVTGDFDQEDAQAVDDVDLDALDETDEVSIAEYEAESELEQTEVLDEDNSAEEAEENAIEIQEEDEENELDDDEIDRDEDDEEDDELDADEEDADDEIDDDEEEEFDAEETPDDDLSIEEQADEEDADLSADDQDRDEEVEQETDEEAEQDAEGESDQEFGSEEEPLSVESETEELAEAEETKVRFSR